MADKPYLPPMLSNSAVKDVMERFVAPTVQANRAITIIVLLALVIVVETIAFVSVFPLKEVRPWVIEYDPETGLTKASDIQAKPFTPVEAQIKYYSNKFFESAMTIDPGRVEVNLAQARKLTKSKATQVLREQIINGMRPVFRSSNDISLTQSYDPKVTSILSESEKTLIVRFSTTERSRDKTPIVKDWQAVVRYTIIPPETEKDIMENPIGFFIVDFNLTEEITKVNKK